MKYPANLCDLSDDVQHAIEVDKQRWWLAHKKYTTCNREEVQQWLDTKADDPDVRADMLRRLNILDKKQSQRLDTATKAMQEGLKQAKQGKRLGQKRLYSNG